MTKYSGFFYSTDGGDTGEYIDLEDALSEYTDTTAFKEKYTDKMYCPECHKAELYLTSNTNKHSFLSKKPTSRHKAGCSKSYQAGSSEETTEYIDNLLDNQIEKKVNSMFDSLFDRKNAAADEDNGTSSKPKESPFSFEISSGNKSIHRSFRVRSLKSYIDQDDDKDKVYLIYGKAKISVITKGSKYAYDVVEVDPQDKYHHVYRIYLGAHKERVVDPDTKYEVLFIGKYDFEHKYYKDIQEDGEIKKIRVWNFDLINHNLHALKYKRCD